MTDVLREKLGSFGVGLIVLGFGSLLLTFTDYEFKVLAWIDMWGLTIGYAIRVGLIVLGGAMVVLCRNKKQ